MEQRSRGLYTDGQVAGGEPWRLPSAQEPLERRIGKHVAAQHAPGHSVIALTGHAGNAGAGPLVGRTQHHERTNPLLQGPIPIGYTIATPGPVGQRLVGIQFRMLQQETQQQAAQRVRDDVKATGWIDSGHLEGIPDAR